MHTFELGVLNHKHGHCSATSLFIYGHTKLTCVGALKDVDGRLSNWPVPLKARFPASSVTAAFVLFLSTA